MAGELLRPGVQVIQEFKSASPSFVRPTLVPCVVGAAFEVLNVLSTDGSINSKAKFGTYEQLGLNIAESSYPDPRGNIDELDIQEETVRPFLLFGGKLNELPRDPGSAFLTTIHRSSQASIRSVAFTGTLGLSGKVLVLAIDQKVRLDTSNDITIVFSGTLSAAQIVEEINDAVGAAVASVVDAGGGNSYVQITSPAYGATSSVTVRQGGSANSILQIGYSGGSAAHEERVEGSGFRGQDQNNNTTQTPWIEFYRGAYILDGVDTEPFPAKAGLIGIETQTFTSAKASAVTFGTAAGQFPVNVGDFFYADGVRLKDGEVMKVEAERFKVGTINTALSVSDSDGNYTTKVYNTEKVNTVFDDAPFAPTYAYFRAYGLNWRSLAPVADSVSGTVSGAPATTASVESGTVTVPASLAGLKIHYVSTIDGVETEGEFTFTGGPFVSVAAIAAAVGVNIPGVTATDNAGKLKLTSLLSGRLQAITVKADGTANASLNFSTVSDTTGSGTDVEFKDIPANLLSATQTVPTTSLTGTTLTIEISSDGGDTFPVSKSHTFTGELASVAAIVADLQGDAAFIGAAPTYLAVEVSGGTKISIRTTTPADVGWTVAVPTGQNAALRVAPASTALGAGKLAYTASQTDVGEEELNGQTLQFKFDHNPHVYDVTFSSNSLDLAVDDINTVVGAVVASKTGGGLDKLKITSPLAGVASLVEIVSGPAATAFGVSTNGSPLSSGRPFPEAYMDDSNVLHISAQMLRDQVTGYPLDQTNSTGSLYIQYKALRKDVSASAKNAAVLRLSDVATLSETMDPITADNPLGLGLFMAMINCPTFETKGLGIDEITAAAPEGTGLAWARAAGFLEAEEVYAVAPLTQDEVVHGIWMTHATVMSEPEQAGERIVFINKAMPTRKNPTIALSGTQANSTSTANQMIADDNPASGLIAAGINPGLPIPEEDMVYMEFEVDGVVRRYSVSSVSGPVINFRVTFTNAETNVDGFFTTTTLNVSVTNAPYKLAVRGESLVIPGSNPPKLDYALVADTVAEANESFKNRRAFSVFPDTIKTVINGIESSLPGYYACAAIAGMCAAQPPQQGFTNFPITGLTGVVGTEKFTKRQLNIMAGGGTYILIQDVQGGAVSSRHQVSTDLTSVETRELSITKVVDFTAKILRLAVRKFIGVNVINNQLLDALGTTVQAVLKFLEDAGVLNGSNLNNIAQDTAAPDTVLIDVTLDVPFPCNYIKLTLVV